MIVSCVFFCLTYDKFASGRDVGVETHNFIDFGEDIGDVRLANGVYRSASISITTSNFIFFTKQPDTIVVSLFAIILVPSV